MSSKAINTPSSEYWEKIEDSALDRLIKRAQSVDTPAAAAISKAHEMARRKWNRVTTDISLNNRVA
jgi:hypothetical protein